MQRLNAKELRTTDVDLELKNSLPKHPITIILDDVLDTYNVGSIFRLADATGVQKVFLCGETLTPPNSRIKKASINTWQWVEWEYATTAVEAIEKVRNQDSRSKIISIEQDSRSVPFQTVQFPFPIAIIVGNETRGVSQSALDLSDMIVELPMWGINTSLNVMVTCGIVLYEALKQYPSLKV